jgi:hypothetical protein
MDTKTATGTIPSDVDVWGASICNAVDEYRRHITFGYTTDAARKVAAKYLDEALTLAYENGIITLTQVIDAAARFENAVR